VNDKLQYHQVHKFFKRFSGLSNFSKKLAMPLPLSFKIEETKLKITKVYRFLETSPSFRRFKSIYVTNLFAQIITNRD